MDSAFAQLYMPEFTGKRELLTFDFDAVEGFFRSSNSNALQMYPWGVCDDYLSHQRETHYNDFAELARMSIDELRSDRLMKVVISRLCSVDREVHNLEDVFHRLAALHRNALVYHFRHPMYGEWMGATPELLFSRKGNEFRTMALAGTLPLDSDAIWSKKLLAEHDFVVQDIIAACRKLKVDLLQSEGPHDVIAGAVKHLETRFSFQSSVADEVLRNVLHPTSAVCGYPRDLAAKWIAEREHHERRLYTGLLGIELGDTSYYFVNLRCAQIFENRMDLFAGVGLTELSVVEEEWNETERKLDTIRRQLYS